VLTSDPKHWYQIGQRTAVALETFDAILMRKDPPFTWNISTAPICWNWRSAKGVGDQQPRAVRDHNEKLAIARFAKFTAPTLVTREETLIREFLAEFGDIAFKPLTEWAVLRCSACIVRTTTSAWSSRRLRLRTAHGHGAEIHPGDRERRTSEC